MGRQKGMFGFDAVAGIVRQVSTKMIDKLVDEKNKPRKRTLFTKGHTVKYCTDEENLEYEVEVKVQVTLNPIFTTPKRDAVECAHYDTDTDLCSEMGCKCKGRCFVDCLYFEARNITKKKK